MPSRKGGDRLMTSLYEVDADGVEVLAYRPMTDEEYAQHIEDAERLTQAPKSALRAALEQLDPHEPITAAKLLELDV